MIEKLKLTEFPPQHFEKEVEIPPSCKACFFYKDNPEKVIGIELLSPYSAFVMKGCLSSLPCPEKVFQLAHFGLGFPFQVISTFVEACLSALRGFPEEEEKGEINLSGLVEFAQKICGFIDHKQGIKMNLPERIRKAFFYLLKIGISGVFTYPLVYFEMTRPVVLKGENGELESAFLATVNLEKDLQIDSKKAFRLEVITLSGEFLFTAERVSLLEEDKLESFPAKASFHFPQDFIENIGFGRKDLFEKITEMLSLINDYLDVLLNSSSETEDEKVLSLGKKLVKLLRVKSYLVSGILTQEKKPSSTLNEVRSS